MLYVGTIDGKVYVACATGIDEAYLAIGRLFKPPYEGDDSGDVYLDSFDEVPILQPGQAVEVR